MLTTWLAAIALLSYVVADSETVTSILIPDQFNSLAGAIHGDILGVAQGRTTWQLRQGALTGTWVSRLASFYGTAMLVEGTDYLYYTYAVALPDPLIDTGECSLAGDIEACVFVKSFQGQVATRTQTGVGTPVEIQIMATGAPAHLLVFSIQSVPILVSAIQYGAILAATFPSNPALSLVSKKKHLAGPIVGGVVGGLVVMLSTVALLSCCRARRSPALNTRVAAFDAGALEDQTLRAPFLVAADSTKDEWAPNHSFGMPSGETRLQAVPSELLAAEEKQALRTVIREEDERERRMGSIEQ
ncbi:hypothetical protein B0H14DRAFT_3755139 [Mycena olivaceomarginata]|nr:hypothetical protein B0H14DRAFT_3755139 [Mycena olivaceomarginata]